MERKEYNGWYNYETWLTHLWMDNDMELYASLREALMGCTLEEAVETLKDWYEARVDEMFPHGDNLFSDILNAHKREVNWEEIAKHFEEETDEVEEE